MAYKSLERRTSTPFVATQESITLGKDELITSARATTRYIRLIRQGNSYRNLPLWVPQGNRIEGLQSSLIYETGFPSILHSLPFTAAKLAELIGCSNTEVKLYLKEKTPLPEHAFTNLCQLLNLDFRQDDWEEHALFPSYFGPLLLTPKSKRHLINSYDAVTRGGDLDIAYEMVSSYPEHRYRYLVVEAYFTFYLFRLNVDWPSCEAINSRYLINFSGTIYVKDSIFTKIRKLCDDVIACPEACLLLLTDFFEPWGKVTNIDEHTVDYWMDEASMLPP